MTTPQTPSDRPREHRDIDPTLAAVLTVLVGALATAAAAAPGPVTVITLAAVIITAVLAAVWAARRHP